MSFSLRRLGLCDRRGQLGRDYGCWRDGGLLSGGFSSKKDRARPNHCAGALCRGDQNRRSSLSSCLLWQRAGHNEGTCSLGRGDPNRRSCLSCGLLWQGASQNQGTGSLSRSDQNRGCSLCGSFPDRACKHQSAGSLSSRN